MHRSPLLRCFAQWDSFKRSIDFWIRVWGRSDGYRATLAETREQAAAIDDHGAGRAIAAIAFVFD
jgi:hypothetical protein